ncbi:hypothetical protein KTQ54_09600 [Komagataeibacter oboediens]|uniref:hypothetical protein n=1 Tax=Komagataeibacter oboediens TaxID=65958 RepID=UPI001C2C38B2|nr:hypothetical protein [Komagataeibacter oboediens]MBV0888793.1 hypothetical protein [Komagataeibacter oboediens]MCK9821752.1 hypothetical protein [Komagataeibacter oboediens]
MAADELTGLIRYLGQEDWQDRFGEVLGDHIGPVLEAGDITFEDLAEMIGPDVAMTLWGCAFEDFLGQDWDDGRNFVDVYLKRRGWKEGPRNSAYMRALKASVMSLYEVSDIKPGQSLMARDLLRGGEPVLVHEGTATRTLKQWDRIAARLIPSDGKTILAGGLLAYSQGACEELAANLYGVLRKRPGKAEFPELDTQTLRRLAPMFTLTWLFRTLEDMARQMEGPALFNGDGEDLVLHEVCFPLAKGVTQKKVADVLDGIGALRPESRSFWNWLKEPVSGPVRKAGRDENGRFLRTEMDDGTIVLGTLELKGRRLRLQVNSKERAERGQAMLQAGLGDLVRAPLTQIMTPAQAMEEREHHGREASPALQIPPEEEARIIGQMLERHYRQVLDEPVPALGDMTPRQAVRTVSGRKKVAAWLKGIENTTARAPGGHGAMAAYDFGWMWSELGIPDLRK